MTDFWQWLAAAAAVPVVGASSLWCGRRLARGVGRMLRTSMQEAITQTVQPQLTAVANRLTRSIEDLTLTNVADHHAVSQRLRAVEERLTAIETRLKEEAS